MVLITVIYGNPNMATTKIKNTCKQSPNLKVSKSSIKEFEFLHPNSVINKIMKMSQE